MTTRSGDTTRPSANSTGSGTALGGAAIRWVHPSLALSVLQDGHVFGRDAGCDTVLSGVEEVSRRHAQVQVEGLVPVLCDLDSRNGVFVNGVRERKRPIGPGDVVRIGECVGLAVELDLEHPSRQELVELADGWYGGAALAAVADAVRRVASKELCIVVQGETGAGKEGIARAVHTWSGRPGAFVAVDCGTLPEALAEGMLFGYRKGAFTGADQRHDGYFRAADGGTLFLDEVLNLSLALQAKLLRAIELREVVPLGETHAVRADVRIVCAAQEPLNEAVAARRFRADLFARLDGFTVVIPPLRERREDVVPLFMRIISDLTEGKARRIEPRFAEALLMYDWPLNVRELVQLAKRLLALHEGEMFFRRSVLPQSMLERGAAPRRETSVSIRRTPTNDQEAFEELVSAIRVHRGNVSKAAQDLGITRSRANRLLEAHPEFDRARALQDGEP